MSDEHNPTLCPKVEKALSIFSRKWVGQIVLVLLNEPKRFCELAQPIDGISEKMLSQRLKELEKEDIIKKVIETKSPLKITYQLTEKGKKMAPILNEIENWSEEYVTI